MKKLNRQEITAIAYRIQEKINQATVPIPLSELDKQVYKLPEYKELARLKCNAAVRRALELVNHSNTLDRRIETLKHNHYRKNGWFVSRDYHQAGITYNKYTPKVINYIDQIKRDITLEQLMCDDLEDLINKITKKYINEV